MVMRLSEVEQAFKELKNDLGLRPIHHQLEHRAGDATAAATAPPKAHSICPSIPRSFVVKTFAFHTQKSLAPFALHTLSRESRAN